MDVLHWLLDADPALRWQVLQDLTDASADVVASERAQVATSGWGAALLAQQSPDDGQWDGGTYRPGWVDRTKPFFDAWTATTYALLDLVDLGLDPGSPQARRAIALVRENSRWEATDTPFFDGETEPCINGMAVRIGAYFGQDVDGVVRRLLSDRLPDGGWNCWAEFGATVSSFHTTLTVIEGLLGWQRAAVAAAPDGGAWRQVDEGLARQVEDARRTGEEYLLQRSLFRRRSDGAAADPRFTMFSYPPRWYYDVLRSLDYLRAASQVSGVAGAGPARDPRCAEAIALVRGKRQVDGRWLLENAHQGPTHLELDGPADGFPSRWNTLRALRVLRWWDGAG